MVSARGAQELSTPNLDGTVSKGFFGKPGFKRPIEVMGELMNDQRDAQRDAAYSIQ